MLSKMKIIAAIDLMQGKVVRLTEGDPNLKVVYSSEPLMVAEVWEREGADMLHIVDLDSTLAIRYASANSRLSSSLFFFSSYVILLDIII